MPKVYLSEQDRLCSKLSRYVYGNMRIRRITQKEMAKKMNISQQSLSRKLKNASFNYSDFLFFVKEFEPSQKELLEIVGL